MDVGAIVDGEEFEAAGLGSVLTDGDGGWEATAGGAVIEAEVAAADGRRAAALARGVDVAAEIAAFGVGLGDGRIGDGGIFGAIEHVVSSGASLPVIRRLVKTERPGWQPGLSLDL